MTFVGNIYDALLMGINDAFAEEIKKKTAAATEAVTEAVTESCKIVEEVRSE